MLSTPLPKLCDKLPEPTYGRGSGFGQGWGTCPITLTQLEKG